MTASCRLHCCTALIKCKPCAVCSFAVSEKCCTLSICSLDSHDPSGGCTYYACPRGPNLDKPRASRPSWRPERAGDVLRLVPCGSGTMGRLNEYLDGEREAGQWDDTRSPEWFINSPRGMTTSATSLGSSLLCSCSAVQRASIPEVLPLHRGRGPSSTYLSLRVYPSPKTLS